MEIYKDIPNYEGLYQVSNLGNVKSLERKTHHPLYGSKTIKEKILKNNVTFYGYYNVTLYKNKKKRVNKVHQLVAMAFLDHTPNKHKLVVNHIDFNKKNNRLDNLEIVSNRENCNQLHLKSSSSFVGVHWNKKREKWCSSIRVNGKLKYLGGFNNEIDASNAYQKELLNVR